MSGIDLADPLRRLLPWPDAARLAELVPERLEVPSGSRVRIDYPGVGDDGGRPVVAVKLQECFGWDRTPRVVAGRVPVLFHLLSPARRPLAVTDDLASFWSGPYAQVRAEMRGRYPRHPWPEDPWTAAGDRAYQEKELTRACCYVIVTPFTSVRYSGSGQASGQTCFKGIFHYDQQARHYRRVRSQFGNCTHSTGGLTTVGNAPSLIAVGRRASSFGHGLETIMDLRKLSAADPEAVAMIRDSGWQGSHLLCGRTGGWDRAA